MNLDEAYELGWNQGKENGYDTINPFDSSTREYEEFQRGVNDAVLDDNDDILNDAGFHDFEEDSYIDFDDVDESNYDPYAGCDYFDRNDIDEY